MVDDSTDRQGRDSFPCRVGPRSTPAHPLKGFLPRGMMAESESKLLEHLEASSRPIETPQGGTARSSTALLPADGSEPALRGPISSSPGDILVEDSPFEPRRNQIGLELKGPPIRDLRQPCMAPISVVTRVVEDVGPMGVTDGLR